ncbi:S-adenosyl methyltransferase [Frankia torreyi]|uniref:S-adenosyl methyltransferase n=2 Tax=Frankia TaxID=1854 RepID=A0A0D8B7F7_9ACTN|nr:MULTISPECIES: SAM-dependent methyltransferase [Frankia]KJE20045.1 S-adenosyl methyltransferase [Frankia torreyi]KQC35707.1 S-adenosyl methyltransferase [Frankia sp. ACN1ag]
MAEQHDGTADPVDHPKIDVTTPHSARIWNYWMGGKDNYPVDREAGDAYIKAFPGIVTLAMESRRFLIRAVGHLAGEAGVHQFLDIGTGLPTMQNTHEVAQRLAPASRIVYVDNDPLVLAHARALLVNTTPEGVTTYVDGDLHEPDQIIAGARNVLNFSRPIVVMFMGILGHLADFDEARAVVARVVDAVPSGSYLLLWDSTNTSEGFDEAQQGYDDTGAVPYILRSPDQVARFFEGLELLEPGVVSISQWRPDAGGAAAVDGYGAVARKP